MPKTIYLAYVQPLSFSGQSAASDMMIEQLEAAGWRTRRIPLYPLNRAIRKPLARYGRFIFQMAGTWLSLLSLLFKRDSVLHLNLGQSLASFLRVGPPFLILKVLRPDLPVVTSLHGSVFMGWSRYEPVARIFRAYLAASRQITVLGESQRTHLLGWGIPAHKLQIVRNTCDIQALSGEQILAKQQKSGPLKLLHLSLLIESKGYPEYLESLKLLAQGRAGPEIDAVLCGPMSFSAYCHRFTTDASKEQWIESMLKDINAQPEDHVSIIWIRGASGKSKQALFEKAQIFIFPSRFPVEAQPLVLVEAMAAGCAIITSDIGEIPSTVDESCAIILREVNAETIQDAILRLEDPAVRMCMAQAATARYHQYFTQKAYRERWQEVLNSL